MKILEALGFRFSMNSFHLAHGPFGDEAWCYISSEITIFVKLSTTQHIRPWYLLAVHTWFWIILGSKHRHYNPATWLKLKLIRWTPTISPHSATCSEERSSLEKACEYHRTVFFIESALRTWSGANLLQSDVSNFTNALYYECALNRIVTYWACEH